MFCYTFKMFLSKMKRYSSHLPDWFANPFASLARFFASVDTPISFVTCFASMAGKTYRDIHGYLRFTDSGKLVHRWKAERKLGRPLQHGEVVHHQNKIKVDNRYGNLGVFDSRKAHQAHHIKEAWTRTRRRRTLKR